jgi:hypothetical protein
MRMINYIKLFLIRAVHPPGGLKQKEQQQSKGTTSEVAAQFA